MTENEARETHLQELRRGTVVLACLRLLAEPGYGYGLLEDLQQRGFDTDAAFAHLCRRDRKLGAWMKRLGPIEADPRWRKPFDPVDALARAILYQQLSGKAAATIVSRLEAAIGSDRFHCDTLARRDDADIRGCGVSGNKLLALRDLARREEAGEIPGLRRMSTMSEDAIVEAAPDPVVMRLHEGRGLALVGGEAECDDEHETSFP